MDQIKKILKVLMVLFAVIGFLTTVFIAYDWMIAKSQGGNVGMGSFPHIFRPNIPVNTTPMSLIYPADFSKDNILLGVSHNVFIGKVLAQTGNKETQIGPRTQYTVEVVSNIKGDLKDIVTVDLFGGEQNGKLVTVEGIHEEDYFLKEGTTYLFATRYDEQENWYTLIAHPNARKELSNDPTLGNAELETLADQDEKVKTFKAAYSNEVLLEADVANNNTRNSFQSLPPEAKAAAVARADAAKASLEASAKGQ
jgi:hypothetical protein